MEENKAENRKESHYQESRTGVLKLQFPLLKHNRLELQQKLKNCLHNVLLNYTRLKGKVSASKKAAQTLRLRLTC